MANHKNSLQLKGVKSQSVNLPRQKKPEHTTHVLDLDSL
jgi:hypothetical protein